MYNLVYPESNSPWNDPLIFAVSGGNPRRLEKNGVVAQIQLNNVSKILDIRRKNAKFFQSKLGSLPDLEIQLEIGKPSGVEFFMKVKKRFRPHTLTLRHCGAACVADGLPAHIKTCSSCALSCTLA